LRRSPTSRCCSVRWRSTGWSGRRRRVDRRGTYRNLTTGLLLGALAIFVFGMTFLFATFYIA